VNVASQKDLMINPIYKEANLMSVLIKMLAKDGVMKLCKNNFIAWQHRA